MTEFICEAQEEEHSSKTKRDDSLLKTKNVTVIKRIRLLLLDINGNLFYDMKTLRGGVLENARFLQGFDYL